MNAEQLINRIVERSVTMNDVYQCWDAIKDAALSDDNDLESLVQEYAVGMGLNAEDLYDVVYKYAKAHGYKE